MSSGAEGARDAFRSVLGRSDVDGLVEASLAISAEDQSVPYDPGPAKRALDGFARACTSDVERASDPIAKISALNSHLFEALGFRGNRDNYYDLENSWLDRVIDRRTGIPITLSIVYLAIGDRLGLRMAGVGLPGHFIVKLPALGRDIFIDPFHGGTVLDREGCVELVHSALGTKARLPDEIFAPVHPRHIITRVLRNLRRIRLDASDFEGALRDTDRIVEAVGGRGPDLRDRGVLHYRLGQHYLALRDLTDYAQGSPEPADRGPVEAMIRELRQVVSL